MLPGILPASIQGYLFKVPKSFRMCSGDIKKAGGQALVLVPSLVHESEFRLPGNPWFLVSEEVLASGDWSLVCKMVRMMEHKIISVLLTNTSNLNDTLL